MGGSGVSGGSGGTGDGSLDVKPTELPLTQDQINQNAASEAANKVISDKLEAENKATADKQVADITEGYATNQTPDQVRANSGVGRFGYDVTGNILTSGQGLTNDPNTPSKKKLLGF